MSRLTVSPTESTTDAAFKAVDAWWSLFTPYQGRWAFDTARVAICCKARQIGYSWATAGGAVYWALVHKRTQVVLSASQTLSDEVLEKARSHSAILEALGYRGASKFSINNATEIAWSSGGKIIALPANPRTARSWSSDVWIDEAAYFQDLKGIQDAVFPMVSRGDLRLRILSTPNGATGQFFDWWRSAPSTWVRHRTTIDEAIAQGFQADKAKLMELAGGDERLYGQFYLCVFVDADTQYFSTPLIDTARNWVGEMPSLRKARWYAGLDVGRQNDLTALSVIAVENGVAWLVAVMTCKRTDFKEQRAMVAQARKMFQWDTLHVDQTGIGAGLAEQLVDDYGETEVIPIQFTVKSKEELCTRTFRWLKSGSVRLPKDQDGASIADEMVAVRRVITNAGNVVYQFGSTPDSHSDRLVSLMLALNAAGEPPAVRGIGQRPIFAVA